MPDKRKEASKPVPECRQDQDPDSPTFGQIATPQRSMLGDPTGVWGYMDGQHGGGWVPESTVANWKVLS